MALEYALYKVNLHVYERSIFDIADTQFAIQTSYVTNK